MINKQPLRGKATGAIGNLFATVHVQGREDMSLPCVLNHWFNRFAYDDPLGGMDYSRLKPWHDAIRDGGLVIMTREKVTSAEDSEFKTSERDGYVGVFAISNFKIDPPHLRFMRDEFRIIDLS